MVGIIQENVQSLRGFKSQPIVSLAEQMRLTPQAVSRAVRDLERAGLVAKAKSYRDTRARLVEITEEGERLLKDVRDHLGVTVNLFCRVVGEDRLATLSDELRELARLPPPGGRSRWW